MRPGGGKLDQKYGRMVPIALAYLYEGSFSSSRSVLLVLPKRFLRFSGLSTSTASSSTDLRLRVAAF